MRSIPTLPPGKKFSCLGILIALFIDYIERIFTDFQSLHGDRLYKEDAAIVGGPADLNGQSVMVLGQQKGRNTEENLKRNFGCPNPEGYRKALRLMRMANRFNMPVISFVDTPGAFPGIEAEERHVAEAIAVNLREMATFNIPIVVVVIGEGGSGGALGVAVADHVMILENAYYSVISPEGCAAILWKDRSFASQAADALKIEGNSYWNLEWSIKLFKNQWGEHIVTGKIPQPRLRIRLKVSWVN